MNCYCGSSDIYQHCCGPLHLGLRRAQTPEQLMRSRFSAYVLKQVPYIAQTYYSAVRDDNAESEIQEFASTASFLSLDVIATAGAEGNPRFAARQNPAAVVLPSGSTIGFVHFTVHFLLDGKLHRLEENSRFVLEQQQWRYVDGVFAPHLPTKIGRNDLCPCGSGQKFKSCQLHWLHGKPHSPAL